MERRIIALIQNAGSSESKKLSREQKGNKTVADTVFCFLHRFVFSKLLRARSDSYDRKGSKAARYRRPNSDKKPLGEPKTRFLTAKEMIQLKATKTTKITA